MAIIGGSRTGLSLPACGWHVRVGRGAGGRPALEVYSAAGLADVSVATSLSVALVRGAVRSRRGEAPWALAWGQLPPGEPEPIVEFTGRAGSLRVTAHILEGTYWVAESAGDFSDVEVSAGLTRTGGRLRRAAR